MNMTATERVMQMIGPRVVVECPVCGDPFFSDRECARCAELEKFYEAQRKANEEMARKGLIGRLPGRVEMGVVPHAPAPKPMPTGAFLVMAGTGISLAVLAGAGGWWLMKRAIEWLAEHS